MMATSLPRTTDALLVGDEIPLIQIDNFSVDDIINRVVDQRMLHFKAPPISITKNDFANSKHSFDGQLYAAYFSKNESIPKLLYQSDSIDKRLQTNKLPETFGKFLDLHPNPYLQQIERLNATKNALDRRTIVTGMIGDFEGLFSKRIDAQMQCESLSYSALDYIPGCAIENTLPYKVSRCQFMEQLRIYNNTHINDKFVTPMFQLLTKIQTHSGLVDYHLEDGLFCFCNIMTPVPFTNCSGQLWLLFEEQYRAKVREFYIAKFGADHQCINWQAHYGHYFALQRDMNEFVGCKPMFAWQQNGEAMIGMSGSCHRVIKFGNAQMVSVSNFVPSDPLTVRTIGDYLNEFHCKGCRLHHVSYNSNLKRIYEGLIDQIETTASITPIPAQSVQCMLLCVVNSFCI